MSAGSAGYDRSGASGRARFDSDSDLGGKMSDDRFRGQDLYNEHDDDDDDDMSAMQQDQGGRVPDPESGPDYAYTPGWDDHPSDMGSGAPPPRPEDAPEDDLDAEDELAVYDDQFPEDDAPESDW